jgi:hypothetical protein
MCKVLGVNNSLFSSIVSPLSSIVSRLGDDTLPVLPLLRSASSPKRETMRDIGDDMLPVLRSASSPKRETMRDIGDDTLPVLRSASSPKRETMRDIKRETMRDIKRETMWDIKRGTMWDIKRETMLGIEVFGIFSSCLRAFAPKFFAFTFLLSFLSSCDQEKEQYDLIIRNGTIYDGSGRKPFQADVAINADTLAFIGDLSNVSGKEEIDAKGLAVAPGFINMLSWADGSLLRDGRSMSDIKQGVTLEIFGEGWSPGPRKSLPAGQAGKNERDSLWGS